MKNQRKIELVGGPAHGKKIVRGWTWVYVDTEKEGQATYKLMACVKGNEYYAFVGNNSPFFENQPEVNVTTEG